MKSTLSQSVLRWALALTALLGLRDMIAQPAPETTQAFQQYAASVEARIQRDWSAGTFLRLAPDPRARLRLRTGEIPTISARSLGLQPPISIPRGQVQHWVGAAFVPHTTIARVIPGLQDYNSRKRYMQPVIVESRVLSRNGDEFRVYLRLQQRSLISAVFDVTLRITYRAPDAMHLVIESKSESVREALGTDAPPGAPARDRGFIWALYDYWRLVEQDGGVYIECEALVLSRQAPALFRWIANGIIARVSERMLAGTLQSTVRIMRDSERRGEAAQEHPGSLRAAFAP